MTSRQNPDTEAFARTMTSLEDGLRVQHVATDVTGTHGSESVATVKAWATELSFNNVPVEADGSIVGVIENLLGEIGGWPLPAENGACQQAMRRLAGDMLIEGKAPLAELVDELLRPPHYRLVVRNGNVDAIVTPSDLGKLPMRLLAFAMLAHLESVMLAAIRSRYAEEEDAVNVLGDDAAIQILGDVSDLHKKQLDPALLEVTSLRQKGEILARCGVFSGDMSEICDGFKDLYEQLRNPLMHASRFVDDSTAALKELHRRLAFVRTRTVEATAAIRG
jgi:predicted transcriptional regulator